MPTIYDSILKRKKTRRLGNELTSVITSKLVQLLNKSCNIDLSGVANPFTQWLYIDLSNLSPHPVFNLYADNIININFHFKHGSASIYLYPETNLLTVAFHFSTVGWDFIFPYNSKSCFLTIDNDMNFISSKFKIDFIFYKAYLDHSNSSTVFLPVSVEVGYEHGGENISTFIYDTHIYSTFLNTMTEHGLNPLFLTGDTSFNLFFSRFLKVNINHAHIFYDEFKEYISYAKENESIDLMVYFFNMFAEHYTNDLDGLSSRLVLTEMRLI